MFNTNYICRLIIMHYRLHRLLFTFSKNQVLYYFFLKKLTIEMEKY